MSCGRAVQRDSSIERLSTLLRRAGSGDQQAFAELHASTRNRLRKTALSVSPSIVDLDDLLQEAYLKIWKNAASFDSRRASPITWMCTIMRNTTIDALRLKHVATADLDEALSVPDADGRDADPFDYDFVQPIAAGVLEKLPWDRRHLLSLAYLEGESRLSLSRRYGVPVGTIKTWLHRTLASVRVDCLACVSRATAPQHHP
jgi:RNA polymerase sigma-70 factor (ECF subfamily)